MILNLHALTPHPHVNEFFYAPPNTGCVLVSAVKGSGHLTPSLSLSQSRTHVVGVWDGGQTLWHGFDQKKKTLWHGMCITAGH